MADECFLLERDDCADTVPYDFYREVGVLTVGGALFVGAVAVVAYGYWELVGLLRRNSAPLLAGVVAGVGVFLGWSVGAPLASTLRVMGENARLGKAIADRHATLCDRSPDSLSIGPLRFQRSLAALNSKAHLHYVERTVAVYERHLDLRDRLAATLDSPVETRVKSDRNDFGTLVATVARNLEPGQYDDVENAEAANDVLASAVSACEATGDPTGADASWLVENRPMLFTEGPAENYRERLDSIFTQIAEDGIDGYREQGRRLNEAVAELCDRYERVLERAPSGYETYADFDPTVADQYEAEYTESIPRALDEVAQLGDQLALDERYLDLCDRIESNLSEPLADVTARNTGELDTLVAKVAHNVRPSGYESQVNAQRGLDLLALAVETSTETAETPQVTATYRDNEWAFEQKAPGGPTREVLESFFTDIRE